MKTDIITVSSKGKQIEKALDQVEKVASYKGLSRKGALHLRLLTEEMMQMMRSITGEPEGEFWIEDKDGEYSLHLKVATRLSLEKREQLLEASTSGKNESARGIMGRLRAFFDWESDEDAAACSGLFLPDAMESAFRLSVITGRTPKSQLPTEMRPILPSSITRRCSWG